MSLVLTLRPEEKINIDGPATITYIEKKGSGEIRLAFDCPKTTLIQRENYVPKTAQSFQGKLKTYGRDK